MGMKRIINIKRSAGSLLLVPGNVLIEQRCAKTGLLLHEERGPNLVVTTGLAGIALATTGTVTQLPAFMAAATGTTAILVGDTTLDGEVGTRIAIGSSSASGIVATYKATYGASEQNGVAIATVGMFDAVTTGNLCSAYVLSSVVNKTVSISLTITWTWTYANL